MSIVSSELGVTTSGLKPVGELAAFGFVVVPCLFRRAIAIALQNGLDDRCMLFTDRVRTLMHEGVAGHDEESDLLLDQTVLLPQS